MIVILECLVFVSILECLSARIVTSDGVFNAHPCKDNHNITMGYINGLPPEDENKYTLFINDYFAMYSKVIIKFDSDAIITLNKETAKTARITAYDSGEFLIKPFKDIDYLGMTVKGSTFGVIPYVTSINIDTEEVCKIPETKILDMYIIGIRDTAESISKQPSGQSCGRRQVHHTELITNSSPTKPGDWPWHAALYRFEKGTLKYSCGGTLISKTTVLTAAHCTTIRGVAVAAEILNVVLGKYNLIGGDNLPPQERQVHEIIVHEDYNVANLDNDISILKLTSEAVYSEYVQPACLWRQSVANKISGVFYGTVVGWGLDHTDQPSLELRQATMPKVSDSTCIKSNPVFFGKLLNKYKFCAGLKNGTSACNGDSGGGFTVFVPDSSSSGSETEVSGSWYLRGIVSVAVAKQGFATCDPYHYVLFTDIAKYKSWIRKNM